MQSFVVGLLLLQTAQAVRLRENTPRSHLEEEAKFSFETLEQQNLERLEWMRDGMTEEQKAILADAEKLSQKLKDLLSAKQPAPEELRRCDESLTMLKQMQKERDELRDNHAWFIAYHGEEAIKEATGWKAEKTRPKPILVAGNLGPQPMWQPSDVQKMPPRETRQGGGFGGMMGPWPTNKEGHKGDDGRKMDDLDVLAATSTVMAGLSAVTSICTRGQLPMFVPNFVGALACVAHGVVAFTPQQLDQEQELINRKEYNIRQLEQAGFTTEELVGSVNKCSKFASSIALLLIKGRTDDELEAIKRKLLQVDSGNLDAAEVISELVAELSVALDREQEHDLLTKKDVLNKLNTDELKKQFCKVVLSFIATHKFNADRVGIYKEKMEKMRDAAQASKDDQGEEMKGDAKKDSKERELEKLWYVTTEGESLLKAAEKGVEVMWRQLKRDVDFAAHQEAAGRSGYGELVKDAVKIQSELLSDGSDLRQTNIKIDNNLLKD